MATKKVAKKKYAVPMKVVRLVQKVQKHILEEPKRFDMNVLAERYKPNEELEGDLEAKKAEKKLPPCGTVACIAGWVGLIKMKKVRWGAFSPAYDKPFLQSRVQSNLEDVAAKHLGLAKMAEDYAGDAIKDRRAVSQEMFYVDSWPDPYRTQYDEEELEAEPNKKRLARIAVKRLDHYLRTGR